MILGISGGFALHGETFVPGLPDWFFHDAAAVLVRDGEVVAAVEEERVTRVKHTNTLPVGAARACLDIAGARSEDVEAIAYFFTESYANNELGHQYVEHPEVPLRWARDLLRERWSAALGRALTADAIHFVPHHLAHARAAYHHAGFDDALVAVIDGNGEDESISIYAARSGALKQLWTEPPEKSLGHLYCSAIELLGYGRFDEYKVMGLAPYGNAEIFGKAFDELLSLRPGGRYDLEVRRLRSHFLRRGFMPRRRGTPFEPEHADFAAALQVCLERTVQHVLAHWKAETGLPDLCVAGGVGLNCTMNGRIARSGLFRRMFVHPASHDAGAALGAALAVAEPPGERLPRPSRLRHVAWGHALSQRDVDGLLERWASAVTVVASGDALVPATADRLAEGAALGWARGRMEFGPRALGQRSILADPRPTANRERINAIIKKREAYRPFAPMVHAAWAREWFELPECECNLDAMIFAVGVKQERRSQLGAVTHLDGSARLQVVYPDVLPDVARLLEEFHARTGVPVLLNTSFNVNAEPIVATAGEALLCFLTSGLDALVLGDHLLVRKELGPPFWLDLVPVPRIDVSLVQQQRWSPSEPSEAVQLKWMDGPSLDVPSQFRRSVAAIDGTRSFRDCGFDEAAAGDPQRALRFIAALLDARAVRIAGLDN